jgi:hypothetical protein
MAVKSFRSNELIHFILRTTHPHKTVARGIVPLQRRAAQPARLPGFSRHYAKPLVGLLRLQVTIRSKSYFTSQSRQHQLSGSSGMWGAMCSSHSFTHVW